MKWISIKDKKPENGQEILACGTMGSFLASHTRKKTLSAGVWVNENRGAICDIMPLDVEYWIPIPDLPNSEN